MRTETLPLSLQLTTAFRKAQERTDAIFNLIIPEAYYQKPIPLRHPFVFYEGHLSAFIWNTLFRKILEKKSFQPDFDTLFARGIDPADLHLADGLNEKPWPTREQTQRYRNQVYEQLYQYLDSTDIETHQHPLLKRGYLFYLLLEHELMHQETLMYMIHQLPSNHKQPPKDKKQPLFNEAKPSTNIVEIPAGIAHLGASLHEFAYVWDNELPAQDVLVPAFGIDSHNVTNGDFLVFIEDGGYECREYWDDTTWAWCKKQNRYHPFFWQPSEQGWRLKDFFEDIPLPHDWPVYVTQAEAQAYARYCGKTLPTEPQWHRAAFGDHHDWHYPWGQKQPTALYGNFNFYHYSPTRVGSFPEGASPYGVFDLVGNGWEWTNSHFLPFPGFQASTAYPQYSADFFDHQHFVLKGGSHFTDSRLLRRSFRNWFYWYYPYAYATFRCVTNDSG